MDGGGDTVVAVITPPGEGGIAALRIAGKQSLTCLKDHFRPASGKCVEFKPFVMRHGYFVSTGGRVVDEVMAVYMPEGKSYTGLPQVEIYCHGGRHVVRLIQDEIIADGAQVAEPGEFTRMAFLSGKIDLAKAEAVAEIVAANTDSSFQAAREHLLGPYRQHIDALRNSLVEIVAEVEASIDFPDEEIDLAEQARLSQDVGALIEKVQELGDTYTGGRIVVEGYRIVIGGRPNAGKSSLFNLLLKQERALVTPTPGTTRDYLSEWIDLEGFKVNIIDTAGLRQGGGVIERAGQKSARSIIERADLLIWMTDLSQRSWRARLGVDIKTLGGSDILLLGNKIDIARGTTRLLPELTARGILATSCKTGKGIGGLKRMLAERINERVPDLTSGIVVTSARHRQKLTAAVKHLKAARRKLGSSESPELTAFDLRQAVSAVDEITGKVYNEDVLEKIFSKFCIGK